jgi:putative DNA primase/helicase
MIDLRALQYALGGEISGGQLLCPGPGHSPKDRSLSVRLINGGSNFVVFSHAGDDWAACKDYVRARLGWPEWQPGDEQDRRVAPSQLKAFDRTVVDAESEPRSRTQDDLDRIGRAVAIWNEGTDPRGTVAEIYLQSRALVLDDGVANTVLRYHPACPWRDEDTGTTVYLPALIAAFTAIDDGTVTAIQRVALTPKSEKIGRRMLGVVHRSAIKLDPANGTLAIGEGVETCLAARQLGHAPAWALGSAGNISKFPLIDGVKQLKILGETGEASAQAIELCGRRWYSARRAVQIVMPETGSDLNDELAAAATA